MTTTAGSFPQGSAPGGSADRSDSRPLLMRADGIELLGPVQSSGYKNGAGLVRRADGQMVHLGPLMYAALEAADGARGPTEVAAAMSEGLGRQVGAQHVTRLAQKLAEQGLLAGTEHLAPPRSNPLLALRWKVLVSNPEVTRRLTAPFTFLFRPVVMWPVLAAFVGVVWFVLIDKGVASATVQAFRDPGLLLLVFGLAVISAGFHELGHAAACRYGGATPGGMGMGLYLVWPAFYTDVTDVYRLPRRDRLRVDLAGLYFNALVAVITMVVWLFWRVDALLLLVALQLLQMVKQLSPVIRADGYHILADATGVPDLYAQMGPTIRRLLPGRRHQPTALTGRARVLVTVWVLVIVPVLLSLMLSAVLLLPHLGASAWASGHRIATGIPHQATNGQVINLLASLLQMVALALPVIGSALIAHKVLRMAGGRAVRWSRGRPLRIIALGLAEAGVVALLAWAWWPAGQYRPVKATDRGTLGGLVHLVSAPSSAARPAAVSSPIYLAPGRHLAVAMIPTGSVSARTPAVFLIPGAKNHRPVEVVLGGGTTRSGAPADARAFPFVLPARPGPGDTQALAVNTTDHGVTYDVVYALIEVGGTVPVTSQNSAYALADCQGCTTVAVSFQVVLVIGPDRTVAPINAAVAFNKDCPACTTTAIADQIVVTLSRQPSKLIVSELEAALSRLGALPSLGAEGSPGAIASQVAAVQDQVDQVLNSSGLLATQPTPSVATGSGTSPDPTTPPTTAPAASSGAPAAAPTTTSLPVTGSTPGTSGTSTDTGGVSATTAPATSAPSTTATSTVPASP